MPSPGATWRDDDVAVGSTYASARRHLCDAAEPTNIGPLRSPPCRSGAGIGRRRSFRSDKRAQKGLTGVNGEEGASEWKHEAHRLQQHLRPRDNRGGRTPAASQRGGGGTVTGWVQNNKTTTIEGRRRGGGSQLCPRLPSLWGAMPFCLLFHFTFILLLHGNAPKAGISVKAQSTACF